MATFEHALVRILNVDKNGDEKTWGNGVLLECGLILTCAHVLKEADSKGKVEFFLRKGKPKISIDDEKTTSDPAKDIALLSLIHEENIDLTGGLALDHGGIARDDEIDITAYVRDVGSKLIEAVGKEAKEGDQFWIKQKPGHSQWIEAGVSGAGVRERKGNRILGMVKGQDPVSGEAYCILAASIIDFLKECGRYEIDSFGIFQMPEKFQEEFNTNLTKLLADRIIKLKTDLAKRTLCEACNASPPLTATGLSEARALLNGCGDSMKILRKAQVSLIRAGTLDTNDSKLLCEIIYLIAASRLGEDEMRHVAWARLNPGKHHGEAVVGTGTRAELIAAGIDGEVPSFISGGPGEKPVGKFSIPIPPENGPDLNGKMLIGSLATYLNEGTASELSEFMSILADKLKESENVVVHPGEDLFSEINDYLRSEREYSQDQRSRYVTIANSTTFDGATKRWMYDLANEILRVFPPLQVVLIDPSFSRHDKETLEILRQVVPENTKNSK